MRLGIDFGTTRTVVAVSDRGNYPVVGFESPHGDLLDGYPSVVATDGERLVYGPEALQRLTQPGWSGLRSFKRLLCGREASFDQRVHLGELDLPLHTVLTGFLQALRRDLLERSNLPVVVTGEEPLEAMIAVPAGASSSQRFLTLEAFRAAGFQVCGVLNEPSAAGVEFAHRYRKALSSRRERVLVYDLGGGTFDASIVDLGDGGHRVVANVGLQDLGGDDFDAALLTLARAGADSSSLLPAERTRLLDHCRQQKEGLNPNSRKVVVDLDEQTSVTVSTADYYAACAPLVERSLAALQRMLGAEGEGSVDELAGVYVVGGASDLPVVARTLREAFGRRVRRSPYPSAATAVGLAIALDTRESDTLEERFSRTFGVFRELSHGADIGFDAILTPELAVPAGGGEWVRRYRAAHNVGHFRFVECDHVGSDGVPVGDIVPFGELRFAFAPDLRNADLAAVPVERTQTPGPLIEERYTIDAAGIVQVRITNLESGYAREHRLG